MNPTKALRTVTDTPVPKIVEQLGVAIAEAQFALDSKAVEIAQAMAERNVPLGNAGRVYSMIELGFLPTFYAFAEATVETKLTFTIREEIDLTVGGSVDFGSGGGAGGGSGGGAGGAGAAAAAVASSTKMFGASLNAEYSRKFGFEVEGASSIAARIVSLPPPARLQQVLNDLALENATTPTP